jgi:hypothetical protein
MDPWTYMEDPCENYQNQRLDNFSSHRPLVEKNKAL